MNDLLTIIDEILILLDNCIPQAEYIRKFQTCRQKLQQNPADESVLQELYILSAPKGFLGDGPLYSYAGSQWSQKKIEKRRWELVEAMHEAINRQRADFLTEFPKN